MDRIDRWAYQNRWRHRHPLEKLLLAGGMLLLSLVLPPFPAAVLITAIMAAVALAAGIPLRVYLSLFTIPAGFLLAGAAGLLVSVAPGAGGGWSLGLSAAGLPAAGRVLARSLAAISCLHVLVMTTPLVDLAGLLRRARVPDAVLDLVMLTYRFLFLFADTLNAMRLAQTIRLGYCGPRTSYRSLALLAAALLGRVLDRARRLEVGLALRGYQGRLPVLPGEHPLSRRTVGGILALEAAVAVLSLW